jgi:2-polyprenyl-3-methyl-5-hydroxy-6-metoxy-1,4-benzoquinol methylase
MGMPSCLFCAQDNPKIVFIEFGVPYLKCRSCGHLYSSYESVDHYDGYFENQENNEGSEVYWDLAHKKMYDSFSKRYMEGRSGKILDVGAGLGFFVKFAEGAKGWSAYGVEISPGGHKFAKEKLKLENFFCGKLEDQPFEPRSFDIITMWDVIEHLKNPRPVLSKCRELLKDGGILFMHTPNGRVQLIKAKIKKTLFGEKDGMHFLEAKDHLHIYREKTLSKVLKECGFGKTQFVHLPPIQAVAGKRDFLRLFMKNIWWIKAVVLSKITFGKINYDNLFAEAGKS